jgi:hypothetical protein
MGCTTTGPQGSRALETNTGSAGTAATLCSHQQQQVAHRLHDPWPCWHVLPALPTTWAHQGRPFACLSSTACTHLSGLGQRVLVKTPGGVITTLTAGRAPHLFIMGPCRGALDCCAIAVPMGRPPGLHKLLEQLAVVSLLLLMPRCVGQSDDSCCTQQDKAPVGEIGQPLRVGAPGAGDSSAGAAAYFVVICRAAEESTGVVKRGFVCRAAGAGGWSCLLCQWCVLYTHGAPLTQRDIPTRHLSQYQQRHVHCDMCSMACALC